MSSHGVGGGNGDGGGGADDGGEGEDDGGGGEGDGGGLGEGGGGLGEGGGDEGGGDVTAIEGGGDVTPGCGEGKHFAQLTWQRPSYGHFLQFWIFFSMGPACSWQ